MYQSQGKDESVGNLQDSLVFRKSLFLHLFEVFDESWTIYEFLHRRLQVLTLSRLFHVLVAMFAIHIRYVYSHSIYSLFQPKFNTFLVDCISDFFIFPVEVWLPFYEEMEIVFLCELVPFPC